MDYEIFLFSRTITAAAALLAVVFGTFIIAGVTSIKMLGFGVAFAILLDATLVRALLVPALMRLFGERNWWAPKSLRGVGEFIYPAIQECASL